jgi:hypothetical protein
VFRAHVRLPADRGQDAMVLPTHPAPYLNRQVQVPHGWQLGPKSHGPVWRCTGPWQLLQNGSNHLMFQGVWMKVTMLPFLSSAMTVVPPTTLASTQTTREWDWVLQNWFQNNLNEPEYGWCQKGISRNYSVTQLIKFWLGSLYSSFPPELLIA